MTHERLHNVREWLPIEIPPRAEETFIPVPLP